MELDLLVQIILIPVRFIFFQKKFRLRQSELIDALLHIADHKNIRCPEPFSRYTADQCLLDLIAVLILIYENFFIDSRKFIRHCSRSVIRTAACKDFECKMFQVIEIHQILFFFCLLEPGGKFFRKFQKHPDRSPAGIHVGKHRIHITRKIKGFHLFDAVLCGISERCRPLFLLRIHLFSPDSRQTSEFQSGNPICDLPVSLRFFQYFHCPDIFRQHRGIRLRSVLLSGKFCCLIKTIHKFLRLASHIPDQEFHPGRFLSAFFPGTFLTALRKLVPAGGDPLSRPRITL